MMPRSSTTLAAFAVSISDGDADLRIMRPPLAKHNGIQENELRQRGAELTHGQCGESANDADLSSVIEAWDRLLRPSVRASWQWCTSPLLLRKPAVCLIGRFRQGSRDNHVEQQQGVVGNPSRRQNSVNQTNGVDRMRTVQAAYRVIWSAVGLTQHHIPISLSCRAVTPGRVDGELFLFLRRHTLAGSYFVERLR